MKALSDMERLYVIRQILSNPKAEHGLDSVQPSINSIKTTVY